MPARREARYGPRTGRTNQKLDGPVPVSSRSGLHSARFPIPDSRFPMTQLWPLQTCGFVSAWADLDVGPDPGPIAVIDAGSGGLNHPLLRSRISKYVAT